MTESDRDETSKFWIERLQSDPGAESRWEALTCRYDARLRVFTAQLLGDGLRRRVEPEDVIDEAWMRIVQRIGDFDYRGSGSLYSWLCLQVRRVIGDLARGRGPEDALASRDRLDLADTSRGQPARQAEMRELEGELVLALESIPELYRRAVVARMLEEKSYAEIAAETGLKENTIAQQVARGLEHWRRALGRDPFDHI